MVRGVKMAMVQVRVVGRQPTPSLVLELRDQTDTAPLPGNLVIDEETYAEYREILARWEAWQDTLASWAPHPRT